MVNELDKIERKMGSKKFRETFKTITCDNGCENLDFEGIERSVLTKNKRTKVYYAHPYSAWERGTNENNNKLIRRFIPKGADIGKFSHERIKMIEHWMNNYPRRKLNGLSSFMLIKKLNVGLFFKFCVNALLWYKIQNSNRVCEPQDGLHALFAS